jgi:hypothetical protein
MAGVVATVAILIIFSLVAFQSWTDLLRRDNEAEMIFRAEDLVRAIQRYRLDHAGQGPLKLEDLLEPGPKGQYYVRQLWTDPLVADGQWGLLFAGPGGTIVDPNADDAPEEMPGLGGGVTPFSKQGRAKGKRPEGPQSLLNPDAGGQVGLPIAGVRTLCEDEPFRVYKDRDEYSDWLFTYLDLETGPGNRQPPGGPRGTQQGKAQ